MKQLNGSSDKHMSLEEFENYMEKNARESLLPEAKMDLSELKAMRALAENEERTFTIKSGGLKIGVINNKALSDFLSLEIEEIEKFIRGEDNLWE